MCFPCFPVRSASCSPARLPGARNRLPLSPCRFAGIDADLKCGTYSVRENRDDARSRTIPLAVIVVPSRSAHPAADPVIFVSPGGPGTTNSEALVPRAWFSWMRDQRHIIIVDLRGTSGPSRLDCDMSNAALGAAEYLNTLFPKDRIDACRDALQRKVDLRSYTTPAIVEDCDEVRRALGYGKVSLWAVSWGTRIEYLWRRMHPETVRSAILEGTAPVSLLNPLPHARSAQDAIDSRYASDSRLATRAFQPSPPSWIRSGYACSVPRRWFALAPELEPNRRRCKSVGHSSPKRCAS